MSHLHDLLDCPVCLERFSEGGTRDPRNLSCGHTLCFGCAGHILQQSPCACPVCRQAQNSTNPSNLPRNFILLALLSSTIGSSSSDATGVQVTISDIDGLNSQQLDQVLMDIQRKKHEKQQQELQAQRDNLLSDVSHAKDRLKSAEEELKQLRVLVQQQEFSVNECVEELQTAQERLQEVESMFTVSQDPSRGMTIDDSFLLRSTLQNAIHTVRSRSAAELQEPNSVRDPLSILKASRQRHTAIPEEPTQSSGNSQVSSVSTHTARMGPFPLGERAPFQLGLRSRLSAAPTQDEALPTSGDSQVSSAPSPAQVRQLIRFPSRPSAVPTQDEGLPTSENSQVSSAPSTTARRELFPFGERAPVQLRQPMRSRPSTVPTQDEALPTSGDSQVSSAPSPAQVWEPRRMRSRPSTPR